ncbi:hypothetical protein M0638_05185 [Roseomonas sp. NAR14]|uniref:Uncharacterized protein n=1 Tax=Roseomonas acroporae TaxID=2937791 RepID=A0A9X1Y669_9PROT|nr:hypothetical protein [Roseomonas acroporae]MCK8783775.1 hypothetical protein [Roseomonas acroporae]
MDTGIECLRGPDPDPGLATSLPGWLGELAGCDRLALRQDGSTWSVEAMIDRPAAELDCLGRKAARRLRERLAGRHDDRAEARAVVRWGATGCRPVATVTLRLRNREGADAMLFYRHEQVDDRETLGWRGPAPGQQAEWHRGPRAVGAFLAAGQGGG